MPKLVFKNFFQSKLKAGLLPILCILFLGTEPVKAQLRVDYGPKAGPSASIFRGKMPFKGMALPKIGYTGGAFVNIRSLKNKMFQFEANILFSVRGNRADYINGELATIGFSDLNETKSYSVSYLEVPLIFKAMLNRGGMVRPYVFGGPDYSGIWGAKFKGTDGKTQDVRNDVTRDDLGLILGGGICWFYLDRWYFLDVRYYHGLINASDRFNENMDPYNYRIEFDALRNNIDIFKNNGTFYNSTLSLTFGVSLSRQITMMR